MNVHRFTGLVLAAALVSAPAIAQTTSPAGTGSGGAGSAKIGTTTPGGQPPGVGGMNGATGTGASTAGITGGTMTAGNTAAPNPVFTRDGEVRASEVIGAAVYNDKDDKLGTVDDILVNKSGQATQAVISVGGVLGVGAKLVAVPYQKLQFSDKVDSKTSRVMLPDTDENALNGMPTYHFASK